MMKQITTLIMPPVNPKNVRIDQLSYCAIPIKLFFNQTDPELTAPLATGSAFYYRHKNKVFLITNWHNVTGIDHVRREFLNKHGAQPNVIQHVVLAYKQPIIKWDRYNTPLYEDDGLLSPKWLVHPIFGNRVDVVAIEIGEFGQSAPCINDIDFDMFAPMVADDVYVLGFPYSLNGGGNFPIWKRGSIATEPDVDIDELPKMMIDTASRSGMSGSLVIYRRRGIHGMEDGVITDDSIIGEIQGFIGIYSGRITASDQFEAQLGIVWKKEIIEEIVSNGVPDSRASFFLKDG